MHKIEAIPGYFVVGTDAAEVERIAALVRRNEPFLMANVRHDGGPERRVIAINRARGTVTLASDNGRPGSATDGEVVPWSECSWT